MTHIASCGHVLIDDPDDDFENDGVQACVKEYTRLGDKCVAYKTLCSECYNRFAKEDMLCYSDKHVFGWLRGE